MLLDTFRFVSLCHKNSKILQDYLKLLINEKNSNGSESQNILRIENTAGAVHKTELETPEEDGNEEYEVTTKDSKSSTMNSCHSDIDITTGRNTERVTAAEKQCLIKREIKVEFESIECLQSSLDKTGMLIDQYHSELDIKEEFLDDPEELADECCPDHSTEISMNSEIPLSDCANTTSNEKQQEANVSESASTAKLYNCAQCSKCFRQKSRLGRHMRMHSGERPYNCSICTKCFISKYNLDYHMVNHTGARLFEYARCPKRFIHKQNLKMHMRTHTGEKRYNCFMCNKCFCTKTHLDRHTGTHADEKPFECLICSAGFRDKSNLKRHVQIHTVDKAFKCSTCDKCFSKEAYLNYHVRVHTGEKPFECSVCNKCFTQKSNLITHARIHTDQRTFKCSTCNKCFRMKSHLNKHVRVHTSKQGIRTLDL